MLEADAVRADAYMFIGAVCFASPPMQVHTARVSEGWFASCTASAVRTATHEQSRSAADARMLLPLKLN